MVGATHDPEIIAQRKAAVRRKLVEMGKLPAPERPVSLDQTLESAGLHMTELCQSGAYAYRELAEQEKGLVNPGARSAALLALEIAISELGISRPEPVFMTEEQRTWPGGIKGLLGQYISDGQCRSFRVNHKVLGARFALQRPQIWLLYNLSWKDIAQVTLHEARHVYQWEKFRANWHKAGQHEADADSWANMMLTREWPVMSQAVLNVTRRI
jgi:hypothetical protein